ncbi:hypothetical protein ACFV0L_07295 [Streptosporangium canum]|uniref:hypothetical protein n=1 Tax=Streptosporangium canum TaxID=324952 RepID=UPI0036AA2CD9
MYWQSFPPIKESIESAGIWARDIAQTQCPELATDAEQVARNLISAAIGRTPSAAYIYAQIDITRENLRIEVHHPDRPGSLGGIETAELSSIATSFGASGGPEGHRMWAALRRHRAAS